MQTARRIDQPERAAMPVPPVAIQAAGGTVDLAVEGLCKSYPGRGLILDRIGFSIARGQSVALIGANGAGKSTLLRSCLRLIEPELGRITLLGEELTGQKGPALRRLRARVGFVFQRHNLVGRLSALSNVVHGAQARLSGPWAWNQAFASRATRQEALHCLDRVGLAHLAMERVDRLSGGQSQRVAIARALMQRPALVMADEPVASLDPRAGEEVMELFTRLMRDEGITLVFTSHHLDHALAYAERLIGLRAGRMVLDCASSSQDIAQLRELYA